MWPARSSRYNQDKTVAPSFSADDIPVGITNPLKVLLEKDGIRAHAVYRVVDEIHEETRLSDGRLPGPVSRRILKR